MVKPFAMLLTVSTIHCMSSTVETMRGRPRLGAADRRVYRHAHTDLFCYRNNRLQEDGKILTQRSFIDILIAFKMLAELVERVALFRARQTGDDIAGQTCFVFFAHGGEAFMRLRNLFGGVVRFRARAFEDMQLKGGKFNLIETQRFGAVRQDVFRVGTGPVENRHKVVAHGTNAALGELRRLCW